MKRYYEKRDNRRGRERICKDTSCNIKLSRYNEDDVCSKHARSIRNERRKIKDLLNQ